ncbi:uncharacterized protein LOC133195768 [Saccostrea echinata]|uniref:uncharacterized protein LOC133195768 n=1 Tax=Saccostrea echinata TaxID=191078 RepID=UPI002A805165|nr:uncharacterized protein LOC133195768 [Saccostrea echinata]
MASGKKHHRSRESHFIYDLPYSITRQICCNLDVDKAWEKLASEIGYTIQDVRIFEMAFQHPNGSPCREVLSDWGSKNATARDLFLILQRIGRRREMQLLESYFNCESKPNKVPFQSHDESLCNGTDTPSMIIRALDNTNLPAPPSKSSTKVSSGAWSTSSMNGSTSMSDKNVNLNTPENPKDKATKKHAEYKAIPSLTDERFYPQKKHDYLGIVKETSGLSSTSSSCCVGKSMSSVKVDKCEMGGPAQGKGDLGEKSLESSWMETLKNKDGYSSLAKEGRCDFDVAVALVGTQSFTNKELNHATNGFSEEYKIGEGAFGEVFRGFLKRTSCAIKRLFPKQDESLNYQEHLTSELKSLIKYRHENIVPLYGYTLEEGETCLVYQYMQSGSLDDRLKCKNNTQPLTWTQRIDIMKGAACGLQYLHTLDQKPLIHGDIKCSNILLDKHMEAKIGDLGLAKHATGGSGQSGKLTHITKKQTGTKQYQTKAYLPPEVIRGNAMSIKGDTFSFGVVMLEVFTGEAAYDDKREGGQFLKDYIKDFSDSEEKCMELRDRRAGFVADDVAKHFFGTAMRCTSQLKRERPDMVQVHTELSEMEAALSQKYTTKCQENVEMYSGCPPFGPISDQGDTRMDEFSYTSNGYHQPGLMAVPQQPASIISQQGFPAGMHQQVYMTGMPPQGFIYQQAFVGGMAGQPITEAMRLQMGYDSGLKSEEIPGYLNAHPTYESDPQKLQDLESEYPSDPQKLQKLEEEEIQQPDSLTSHEMPTLGHGDIYQSDMHKLEEIQAFEESLLIPSEAQPAQIVQQECVSAEPSSDVDPAEVEITVSGIQEMTLTDTSVQEYSESVIVIQNPSESEITPENVEEINDLPGGNQERLAQEIAAVGKKSFGVMSLFEKYKEALEMEGEEDEEYDTGESVEYEEELVNGVEEEVEDGYYGQQDEEEEDDDTLVEEVDEEESDLVTPEAPSVSEVPHHQTPSIVHYTPSSPTETTEEDCGENDSKLFADDSGTLDSDILTQDYQTHSTSHLVSDDFVSDSQLFPEQETSNSRLFSEKRNSNSCIFTQKSKCVISGGATATDIKDSRNNSAISIAGTGKDVKLQQVSPPPHWQKQRLEPSEGECFV